MKDLATQKAEKPFATDSLDVLFFTKPFKDSIRYTRYFRVAKIRDTAFEGSLLRMMAEPFSLLEKPRPCLSEGKIIVPKGGDSFKVLYFSRAEDSSCAYIYEIREGLFRYYEMPEKVSDVLKRLEETAKQ